MYPLLCFSGRDESIRSMGIRFPADIRTDIHVPSLLLIGAIHPQPLPRSNRTLGNESTCPLIPQVDAETGVPVQRCGIDHLWQE